MTLVDMGLTFWALISIVMVIASVFYLYFGHEMNEDFWADKRFRLMETRIGAAGLVVSLASVGGWCFVVLN